MALAEIDRVIAAGVRFGCVLADAGYGMSAPFRQGLTARKLAWRSSWRTGTKGKLKARFAAVRVRIADGAPQRQGQRPAISTGEEAWLIGEHRMSERKNTISPTCREDGPAHRGGHYQGAMDLRAGSPAAKRRIRSRSLRGTILARPSSPCAHDDDRVRLPPASPPRNSKAGKKKSTGTPPQPTLPAVATPSSSSSLDYRRSNARIAENGFATSSGVSKSAKVVLRRVLIKSTLVTAT